jgi:hypothetical protein
VAAPAAHAYVAPGATIVSASLERLEQADDATLSVAISGDGRYVAFHTRARNFFADHDPDPPGRYRQGGIFRRDLQSGALELVAHGDVREEQGDAPVARGTANPSLSTDGRYVAFSTAEPLATLVTTQAGSSAAGSQGVSDGAKGDPKAGEPDPVPQPANPSPETLQYVTVYDNGDKGGFAGSKPVSQPETFRCGFEKRQGQLAEE